MRLISDKFLRLTAAILWRKSKKKLFPKVTEVFEPLFMCVCFLKKEEQTEGICLHNELNDNYSVRKKGKKKITQGGWSREG